MARLVTPIQSGCHSPEPRAVRTTHWVADRCTSIAPSPRSRKHFRTPGNVVPVSALHHYSPLITVRDMTEPGPASTDRRDLKSQLDRIASAYAATANVQVLRTALTAVIANATPDALIAAAEPYRDDPELIAPIYEAVVNAQPANARALVILANAYWLQGRGPQAVAELATRAIAADPANRGAWHLWALSESNPRGRVRRWQQVSERFPADTLATAAMADNAASVAGAEHDYAMLDFAIETYEKLLERTSEPAQREAVTTALAALRGWRF